MSTTQTVPSGEKQMLMQQKFCTKPPCNQNTLRKSGSTRTPRPKWGDCWVLQACLSVFSFQLWQLDQKSESDPTLHMEEKMQKNSPLLQSDDVQFCQRWSLLSVQEMQPRPWGHTQQILEMSFFPSSMKQSKEMGVVVGQKCYVAAI